MRTKYAIVSTLVILLVFFTVFFSYNEKDNAQPELLELKIELEATEMADSLLVSEIQYLEKLLNKNKIDSIQLQKTFSSIKERINSTNHKKLSHSILSLEKKIQQLEKSSADNKKDIYRIIFSWPSVVLYIVITLVFFKFNIVHLQGLFGRVKSISIFGNSVEFSNEIKVNTEIIIRDYRSRIKDLFKFQINSENLEGKLRNLVEKIVEYLNDNNFRCTIHIPDALFQDTLYQLLNYYPKQSNGGLGRIKSIRFGIIGLSWRSEKSKIRGDVNNKEEFLIKNWGMDKSETTSDASIKSFAAILLKDNDNQRLAVVYFDSKEKNLFGDKSEFNSNEHHLSDSESKEKMKLIQKAKDFEERVIDICEKELNITKSLENIRKHCSDKFLQFNIYE